MEKIKRYLRLVFVATVSFFGVLNVAHVPPTIHETWQEEWDDLDRQDESKYVAEIVDCLKNKSKSYFILGAATADYQILGQEGLPTSQMAHGESLMVKTDKSGAACGGWQQHFDDIRLLEQCGLNGYRFSIDWSAIQPDRNSWNKEKLQHYIDFCKALKKRHIKVMVTLHHFVHPQWFEKLGAFEHSENIGYFVNFCEKVFAELAPYVDQWCTINEPGIYMFQSYIRGVFPPFKSVTLPYLSSVGLREGWAPCDKAGFGNIKLAGQVLSNLLDAHVIVYQTLQQSWLRRKAFVMEKQALGLSLSEHDKAWISMKACSPIGFVHQCLTFRNFHKINQLIPYQSLCAGALFAGAILANHSDKKTYGKIPIYAMGCAGAILMHGVLGRFEATIANMLNNWIHESVMNFFESGTFAFLGAANLKREVPQAKRSFDFVGLNYYSVVSFNLLNGGPDYYDKDVRTDMPYGVYAEGLYRAIERMSKLEKPIYITENGVADKTDSVRNTWIKRHFWAIKKSLESGYDVRGFFYWSLMDNWEWDMGYGPKFGLYHVDFNDKNRKRTLRAGSSIYQTIGLSLNNR
jgi:beta-glucosidase/6-phospho-beta-glucosidase/beta-galactosidase